MSISRKIFEWHTSRFVERNKRRKQFVDYDHIKSVLLLYESDWSENREFIASLVQKLQSEGKKVVVVGYINAKKSAVVSSLDFLLLTKEHLSLFKRPKNALLNEILQQSFDAVIDLTPHFCLPLQYVLLHAQALCKISGEVSPFGIVDFAVELNFVHKYKKMDKKTTPDVQYEYEQQLWQQVEYYLKQIKQVESSSPKIVPEIY